jgi:hypothetical protein
MPGSLGNFLPVLGRCFVSAQNHSSPSLEAEGPILSKKESGRKQKFKLDDLKDVVENTQKRQICDRWVYDFD